MLNIFVLFPVSSVKYSSHFWGRSQCSFPKSHTLLKIFQVAKHTMVLFWAHGCLLGLWEEVIRQSTKIIFFILFLTLSTEATREKRFIWPTVLCFIPPLWRSQGCSNLKQLATSMVESKEEGFIHACQHFWLCLCL